MVHTISVFLGVCAYAEKNGERPSVYVAPRATCMQLRVEIEKFFGDNLPTLLVRSGQRYSIMDLHRYAIILVPYSLLGSEYSRYIAFEASMSVHQTAQEHLLQGKAASKEMRDWMKKHPPKRPHTTFISDVWRAPGCHRFRYLVLDEAHVFKNPKSNLFAAVMTLRSYSQCAILITGTPIDNTYKDVYALLACLDGHPFGNYDVFMRTFSTRITITTDNGDTRKRKVAANLCRLAQILDATGLRRPNLIVLSQVPTPTRRTWNVKG